MRSGWRSAVAIGAAVIGGALMIVSCASVTKTTDWRGHKIAEAEAELGRPASVTPGENGGSTYTFRRHHSMPEEVITYNSQGAPVSSTRFRDSVQTWTFSVDSSGTIVTWNMSEPNVTM